MSPREKARASACQSNLKQIALAHLMYVQDHGETLPPAPHWPATLHPYIKNNEIYRCPSDQSANVPTWQGVGVGYAVNGAVGGMNLKAVQSPADTPLSFDAARLVGGQNDAVFRHNEGANCAYTDGHVTWVRDADWASKWHAPTAPARGPRAPAPPSPMPESPSGTTSEATHPQMSPRERARASACQSNLREIVFATHMYVLDYDGMMPSGKDWPDAIDPHLRNEKILVCPSDGRSIGDQEGFAVSYALDDTLSRVTLRGRPKPALEIMYFDALQMAGGADAADFRHVGGLNAAYADGHVQRMKRSEWQQALDAQRQ